MKPIDNTTGLLFPPNVTAVFPSTRYQGSKAKIVNWIWGHIKDYDFHSCLDAFGGTGVVAYRLKLEGKQVSYNDSLQFNYLFGKALIENSQITASQDFIQTIQAPQNHIKYPSFIQDTFQDIYFTDDENHWLDVIITNLKEVDCEYQRAISFFSLAQACIIKRPYNLFHRKNLYVRLAEVERSFGNKSSWDKSFPKWFATFSDEANNAVFEGEYPCKAYNLDALDVPGDYDLVYIDTPYISGNTGIVDYADFYHFLEGLCNYDHWKEMIDWKSKHRRLKRQYNRWTDKKAIHNAFDELLDRYAKSIIILSYRSDGVPSIDDLVKLFSRHNKKIRLEAFGQYKYVLSKNKKSQEILLIGE